MWPPLRHLPGSIATLLEIEKSFNPIEYNESENSPLFDVDPCLQVLNDAFISNSILSPKIIFCTLCYCRCPICFSSRRFDWPCPLCSMPNPGLAEALYLCSLLKFAWLRPCYSRPLLFLREARSPRQKTMPFAQ